MAETYAKQAYPEGGTMTGYASGMAAPECEMAPLDVQVAQLLSQLSELVLLVENLEPPNTLRAIRPDKPAKPEGLTSLVALCQSEVSALGMALRSIAQRIGRL